MSDDQLSRSVTVCRRDSVHFVLSFAGRLPATWEDLQLVFLSEAGARLSRFVKRDDVQEEVKSDGSAQYAFNFTIDGTDPLGTFALSEGAVRLRDGFIIRWNPQTEGSAISFSMTIDYTPERIVALDAMARNSSSAPAR